MSTRLRESAIDPGGEAPYGRYRRISPAAVASVIFGALSVLTPLHWLLGLVPAIGIALGWWALMQIREFPAELTGRGLARLGLWLSVAFWVAGHGWLALQRVQEVPHGYQRVTYDMLQPDPEVRGERIPPAVFELQDKKVFIRGYMQADRQQTRLKAFILCPAMPNCDFCIPDPKPTEMILVELQGDLEARYTTHLKRLGGKFQVNAQTLDGVPYRLKADYMK